MQFFNLQLRCELKSVETDRSWAAADSAQTDRLASRQTQLTVVVYSDSKLDQKEEDSAFRYYITRREVEKMAKSGGNTF